MGSIRRVLLVDDCATIRTILKVYLMNLGAEFIDASDGTAALDLLSTQPIDLVIADIRMAPMDGIAFVEQLRMHSSERVRGLPVILLTSDRDEAVKTRGMAAGANALIYKPISSASLAEAVAAVSADRQTS